MISAELDPLITSLLFIKDNSQSFNDVNMNTCYFEYFEVTNHIMFKKSPRRISIIQSTFNPSLLENSAWIISFRLFCVSANFEISSYT